MWTLTPIAAHGPDPAPAALRSAADPPGSPFSRALRERNRSLVIGWKRRGPHALNLFLVEDHPVMRRAYAQVIGREPDLRLCGSAASAEEALDALTETPYAPCDLLLADMALPGMDGAELAERLRDERPDLRALVISAHDDEAFERRTLEAGAVAYLRKRDAATDLVSTIRRLLSDAAL